MLWIIIGLIITIYYVNRSIQHEGIGWGIDTFILGAFITVGISAIICIIAGGIISVNIDPVETHTETELVALSDGQSISGDFFLGCGVVDETTYYFYIVNTEYGMKSEKISADNVYIQYCSETPKIDRITKDFPADSWYWVGIPCWQDTYIMYVPEGSVTSNFNVDLVY